MRPEGVTGDEKRVGDHQFPEPPNTDPYSKEGGKGKEEEQKDGSRRKKARRIIKLKGEDEE